MLCSISRTHGQVAAGNIFVSYTVKSDLLDGFGFFAGDFKLMNSNNFKYSCSNKLTDAFKSTRRDVLKLVLPFISIGVAIEMLKALPSM